MTKREYVAPNRDIVVLISITFAFSLLVARAAHVQIVDAEWLQAAGNARFLRSVKVVANRGIIKDRNGLVLAVSTPVDSVWANPQILNQHAATWGTLEEAVGMPKNTLAIKLAQAVTNDSEFMYIRRSLEPHHAQEVMELDIPGVSLQREYRRYYPYGASIANLIGYTNIDDIGIEGIELAHNEKLTGQDGLRRVIKDRKGRIVETRSDERRVRDGEDIYLSIDARIQQSLYQTLSETMNTHGASNASAVVVDVYTGEILAICTLPTFNPNVKESRGTTNNFVARHAFEPVSVIKPFVVAKALMEGRVDSSTVFDTSPGRIRVDGFVVEDYRDYGELTVAEVLSKSSNVGAIKIGNLVSVENMVSFFRSLGLMQTTDSGIVGETAGIYNDRDVWRTSEKASLTYGYGLAVTMLQVARAYSAIANGGKLIPLSILATERAPKSQIVMHKFITREIATMLEQVVAPSGTAKRAGIPLYRVAGKTSTTQKLIDGQYQADRHRAMFAGFAPASNPRLAAVVVVDEPSKGVYFGGHVAAPAFREIMGLALRILNVPPDNLDKVVASGFFWSEAIT